MDFLQTHDFDGTAGDETDFIPGLGSRRKARAAAVSAPILPWYWRKYHQPNEQFSILSTYSIK
jgi:hypothetical protein